MRSTEEDVLETRECACVSEAGEAAGAAADSWISIDDTFAPPGEHRVQRKTMAISIARAAV